MVFQAEDGCSEESSSDEKELEEPMSVTSQESSSQEIESDSKQSPKLNNDSSTSSPLSSCQTLTSTDQTDAAARTPASPTGQNSHLSTFHSEIPQHVNILQASSGEQEIISASSVSKQDVKDTCNFKSVVKEREEQSIQELSQQSIQDIKDNSEDLNSVALIKDRTNTKEVDLHSSVCISSSPVNSLQQKNLLETSADCQDTPIFFTPHHSANDSILEIQNESSGTQSVLNRIHTTELHSSERTIQETETSGQCNSGSSLSNESIIKTEDSVKPLKQKKPGKQANVKNKKNSKGKEDKQRKLKTSVTNYSTDINLERGGKKKDLDYAKDRLDDNEILIHCRAAENHTSSVDRISSEITIEAATPTETDTLVHEPANSEFFERNIAENSNTFLDELNDKFQISNSEAKVNSAAKMDGHEKKSTSDINEPINSEESMHSGRSSQTGKHDLFMEFKSSCQQPPARPVRKEKRKSFPTNAISPDQNPSHVPANSSVTPKPLQLPAISLRPDVPKTEHKSLYEGSTSQQLKGTADILESITAALTTDPPITKTLQVTLHKDNPVSQKAECTTDALQSPESSLAQEDPADIATNVSGTTDVCSKATEEKLLNPQVDITGQTTLVSVERQTHLNEKKCYHENLNSSLSLSGQKESEVFSEVKHAFILKDKRFEEGAQSKTIQGEVQPPVPPPRGKKLHASKHKLTEHSQPPGWDLESGSATDESSGDSTTSSTTHESEESVIELLSSTHTSPDDRPKQDLSSDEEEDIIFRAKTSQGKAEMMDIKSVPPDKRNAYIPSTSGPSLQDASQTSDKNEPPTSKTPPKHKEENVFLEYSEIYADGLSKIIISEAVSESSKKRMCLPITEAVARWLRNQSPEILSLPLLEDETESDISSEEQECDERTAEATGNKQVTGQKNVLCNPLPVPLLEDCHCLLVDSGYKNGTGRRVALNDCQYFKPQNENIASDKYDNNRTISVSTEGDKRLINLYDDKGCILFHKDNHVSLTPARNSVHDKHECHGQIEESYDRESVLTQCPKNVSCDINFDSKHASSSSAETVSSRFNDKDGMNRAESRLQNEISLSSAKENSFLDISQDAVKVVKSSSQAVVSQTSSVSQMKCRSDKNELHWEQLKNMNGGEHGVENSKSDLLREYDECSFTSEETVEGEWDLWDCNPVKFPSVLATPKNQMPVDDILARTPEDYCSHMCDPTVSVAKYYNLGALQRKSVMPDEDEILSDTADSSDEEVDALKHFQYELEDDDGLQTAPLRSSGTGNSDKKSDEEHERNKTYGNPEIYKNHYGICGPVSSSGVQFQDEAEKCKNVYNTALSQRAQAAHLFHRKSSVLVSKLKGEGPFPCGGICCILQ